MEENFENDLTELKRLYGKDPVITSREVKRTIEKVRLKQNNRFLDFLSEINWNIVSICLTAILVGLLGLVNPQAMGQYYFGFVFFAAGTAIGLFIKGFGIIFLFSHGVLGMSFMVSSILGGIVNSPKGSDLPASAYIYLVVGAIALILAVISVIIYNLSDSLKLKRGITLVPTALYIIGFTMLVLFPKLYGIEVVNMF